MGTWSGVLDAGSQRLRLKLDFRADQTATISSLDQGNKPTAGRIKSWTADQVEVEFPSIRSIFAGRLIDKDQIEGVASGCAAGAAQTGKRPVARCASG
jgi:hypothetical protein